MPSVKQLIRDRILAERATLDDRPHLVAAMERHLRQWLGSCPATTIGAYWPINLEFDPIPALCDWLTVPGRSVALPVVDPAAATLTFRAWRPGDALGRGALGTSHPVGTPVLTPTHLLVPCVGYGPGGVRLGYGGGYYDRTLAKEPRPVTLGLCFASGFDANLPRLQHDVPLDAVLTEQGVQQAYEIS